MLACVAGVLDGAGALTGRHLRRRGRFLSPRRLSRFVCLLAVIRAVEIARRRVLRRGIGDDLDALNVRAGDAAQHLFEILPQRQPEAAE